MPELPLGAVIAGAISSAFSTTILGVSVGQVALTAALTGANFLLNQLQGSAAPQAAAQTTLQESIYDERLIYGRALVGGRLFFYECKPPWLYIGLEIASHEIDGIEAVYCNGNLVTFDAGGASSSVNYKIGGSPYIYMSLRRGAPGQGEDSILAADFPELATSFRQQGHACVVMKVYYGADATEHNTLYGGGAYPEFLFLTRGMKVYDPRDGAQSITDASTWKWSNNASLCIAHYATFVRGHGLPWSVIDLPSLKASADNDDQGVSLASGAVEKRFRLDGLLNPNDAPGANLQQMLTANLGDFIWSAGVYKLQSAAPKSPVWTLTDDSARGDMDVRITRDKNALVNVAKTVFAAQDRSYQTVNGPILSNASYLAADGASYETTLNLPFTASQTMAQRIAKATMEKSRKGRQATRRENIEAITLEAADVVTFQVNSLPALGGVFKVNKILLDHTTFEVSVEMEEYDPNWLAWSTTDEQPFTISPSPLNGVR